MTASAPTTAGTAATGGSPVDAATFRRIESFLTDYIHCIDDDRLEQWPDFFLETGHYVIITRENHDRGLTLAVMECDSRGMMVDRIASLRRANVYEPHTYRHQMSALQVEAVEGGWRCRANYLVVRTMHDGAMAVFSTGRYLDRIVEQDGALRFAERLVIAESRRVETLLVIPI